MTDVDTSLVADDVELEDQSGDIAAADNQDALVGNSDHADTVDKSGADADSDGDDNGDGVPKEYEDFKLEGQEFSEEDQKLFKDLAKDLNLSQEQAQKLVEHEVAAAKQAEDTNLEVWRDTVMEWREASRKDKEYGGTKFDENLAVAKKAVEKFGSKELLTALTDYGMGNHPEFIRFFYRVGKAIAEDKMFSGPGGERTPSDPASILYPNQN